MVDATEALVSDKSVALFSKYGIMDKVELESRAEILYDTYAKVINIEALTMIDMASKDILPSVIKYTTELAASINEVVSAGADASVQKETLDEITVYLKEAKTALTTLKADQAEAEKDVSSALPNSTEMLSKLIWQHSELLLIFLKHLLTQNTGLCLHTASYSLKHNKISPKKFRHQNRNFFIILIYCG